MKVFVDEDAGSSFASGLIRADFADVIDFVAPDRTIRPGTHDVHWIPHATSNNMLILSCNYRMLNVREELRLLVAEKARAIYLPAHDPPEVLVQLASTLKSQFEAAWTQEGYAFYRVYRDRSLRRLTKWRGQIFLQSATSETEVT